MRFCVYQRNFLNVIYSNIKDHILLWSLPQLSKAKSLCGLPNHSLGIFLIGVINLYYLPFLWDWIPSGQKLGLKYFCSLNIHKSQHKVGLPSIKYLLNIYIQISLFCLLGNFLNLSWSQFSFQQRRGYKTMTDFVALCEGLKHHKQTYLVWLVNRWHAKNATLLSSFLDDNAS